MALVRITDPTVTPITLAEAKKHLRVSTTDQDDLITMYLKAATDYVDGEWGFLGRALVTQKYRLTLDAFPAGGAIKLPLPPLQAVTSVAYDAATGLEIVLTEDVDYFVDSDSEPGWVLPVGTSKSWPSPIDAANAVRIEYLAGYDPSNDSPPDQTANIPFNIKAGIMLIVASMFEHREEVELTANVMRLPFGADILLRRHKIDKSMA